MKNINLQSPDRLIHHNEDKMDPLSSFLQEYAPETTEKLNPADNPDYEITRGIQKLNEILEGLNLPPKKDFMADWITPEQVKLKLGIAERTLTAWRQSGKLPFTRIQNKLYYKIQDIESKLLDGYKRKNEQIEKP